MMLGEGGGVKNAEDLAQMVSLMEESTKMVRHCTYLNILRSTTDQEILQQFVNNTKGWSILNDWLQEGKTEDNQPMLLELLQVYQQLPVTVDILKQNHCPKVIKQLIRSENQEIKTLASTIVDTWMKIIKGRSDSSSDKSKKRSKRHHHHHHHKSSTSEDTKSALPKLDDSAMPGSPDSMQSNDSSSLDKFPDDGKDIPSYAASLNISTSSSTNVSSKPKTVKVLPTKFRSTGLELENDLLPASKKKTNARDKAPLKRISVPKVAPTTQLEKRPRAVIQAIATSPAALADANSSAPGATTSSPTESSSKVKLIPAPKKAPISELYESSGFMDALTNSVVPHIVRKKRRISTNSNGQSTSPQGKVSTPTSPPEKKPLIPSFYKDTLETSEEQSDAVAMETEEHPSEDANGSSPSQEREPPVDEGVTEADKDVEMKPDDGESTSQAGSEVAMETVQPTSTVTPEKKKKKKRVSWAQDASLKVFHYFELDETERVNVNRLKDFAEVKRQEMMLERRNFQVRKHSSDQMEEQTIWHRPPIIDNLVPPMAAPGCNSQEKHLQKEREQGVLQALYFSKEMIPDNPKEPEPEKYEPEDPQIIPLNDVTGESGEVVHASYPEPVHISNPSNYHPTPKHKAPPAGHHGNNKNSQFSLPPDVAAILANITTNIPPQNANPNHQDGYQNQNMGQGNGGPQIPPEMAQMLSNMAQQGYNGTAGSGYQNSMPNNMGGGLPPHIQGYLHDLQKTGQYSPEMIDQFRQMLMMMPQAQLQALMPGAGSGPMRMQGPPPPKGQMPPPNFSQPPPRGMPPRYPGDDWNENMRGGPKPNNRGGPGMPQGGERWRGPNPNMGPPGPGGPMGPPPPGMMGPPSGGLLGPGPPGPPMMSGRGGRPPRPRGVCRYFMSQGGCSNGPRCNYLHPGVNGPPL